MLKLHKCVMFLFLIWGIDASAQKLSLGFGAYSVDATVGSNTTTLSNIGSYQILYHSKIQNKLEFILGYNILIENIVSGDKAFGPFIGFSYFPFGTTTATYSNLSNISILNIKQLNPYIYAGFNQRQYQTVKATYSGFSIGAGSELGWSKEISFYSDLQYSLLTGPNEGEASEIIGNAGIIFHY